MTERYTPEALARLLEPDPAKVIVPTEAQQRVICAPVDAPALVVAGAGSGKTETMAARVVWLVANGLADPGQILGLTFTRKAAQELAHRIRRRLRRLSQVLPDVADPDPFAGADVATYHSFAASMYREHALRIGEDPDAVMLGEAAAWLLARDVVLAAKDARLADLEQSAERIIDATLSLARAMTEHGASPDQVIDYTRQFTADLSALPKGPRQRNEYSTEVAEALNAVAPMPLLVDLALAYQQAKRARGALEFSDLVSNARRIVQAAPDVVDQYRDRYRTIILDEYQDTDVGQAGLLATLFRDRGVMAVGDPNQSIYGWRGASADGLAGFLRDFRSEDQPPIQQFALMTSWRNDVAILHAANAIVPPAEGGLTVPKLVPRPSAGAGTVDVRYLDTLDQEAAEIATWFAGHLRTATADTAPPSAAILLRTWSQARPVLTALAEAGVPYRVLGLGGLFEEPAVADLVCALRVIDSTDAGSELVRLLAGARWRIAPADLWQLRGVAHWLQTRDHAQQPVEQEVRLGLRQSVDPGDGASIVDALDFLSTAPEEHSQLQRFSERGRQRLRAAGRLLQRLRRRAATAGALELVQAAIQELHLDIEVAANESAAGEAALEAFLEQVRAFQQLAPGSGLRPFLAWLHEAERRERLAPRAEPAQPGRVQILTVHGAKGLEWDLVAVPRMVEQEFPKSPRSARGWLTFGALPYELQADADSLPQLQWTAATNQSEFKEIRAEFEAGVKARYLAEERRLAYVAVTRARSGLLLTGSFWGGTKAHRGPSEFLQEIVADAGLPELPTEPTITAEEAYGDGVSLIDWPLDPLGARGRLVAVAAAAVRAADPEADHPWREDIELLLAERARRVAERSTVTLPVRVPASRFKDYISDPAALAAQLRRPMPERPFTQTRLGTLFHTWVEQRAGLAGATDPLDDLFGAELDELGAGLPDPEDEARLIELQQIFERSEWASRKPWAVELELNLQLADRVVICKLDAIYHDPSAEQPWQIVDWKTGKAPKNDAELEQRQYQLALYRLAFAEWQGVPLDQVDAVFYYVADDRVIRPTALMPRAELERRWTDAVG